MNIWCSFTKLNPEQTGIVLNKEQKSKSDDIIIIPFVWYYFVIIPSALRAGQINGCTSDVISGLFRVRVLAEGFSA